MTIQEAVAAGYRAGYIHPHTKIGDIIRMRKSKPFIPSESILDGIIGWDRWGPRFEPMHDECQVVLQSQEDLDFFRRQMND